MIKQSTRLKCRTDIYYTPMADGVYLRSNSTRLILKGKSLYRLLENLAPTLNGEVSLAEVTEGLDADRQRMITHLLEKLTAHHFLQDTGQDQPHGLNQEELETYAPNLAFIESFQTSAASHFERFRNMRLLLIGSGPGLASLLQASLHCGVKQVDALWTSKHEIDVSAPQELDTAASLSEKHIRYVRPLTWENKAEARETVQAYDAILHITEQPFFTHARLLNTLCIEEQKTLIQAVIADGQAWIGPLVCPETSYCWECAWLRLQAHLDADADGALRQQPPGPAQNSLTGTAATLLANQLLFALFRHVTHIHTINTAGKLDVLDLKTLLSESHAFQPHPHCQTCQHPSVPTATQFLGHMRKVQQQASVDPDRLWESVAQALDKRTGLFSVLDYDFVQVPLAMYAIQVSNPTRTPLPSGSVSVLGVGIDPGSTRIRAAQKACECYAASFVDQRLLLPPEMADQGSWPVIQADQLLDHTPLPPEDVMWTWALDLHTHQPALVPATAVFSSFHQRKGVASGMIWEEAVCQALLDWCNDLTMKQAQENQQAYHQIDLDRAPLTPEGQHLYRLLRATARHITVYDVTGSLQIPTFAICLDEKIVAYSTHCDTAQALRVGLEQALQQYQSEQFQHHACAIPSVPDLPMHLRSERLSLPNDTAPGTWSARQGWLLERLQANGLHAYVVPLNHDPALAQILPYIVRILLSRNEPNNGK